jgi:hypothetical protein
MVSVNISRTAPQLVFTKTRILSVKVATLVTFLSMIKTLDQVMLWLSRVQGLTDYCPDKSDAKACPSPFEDSYQGTGGDGAFG